jgi:hypothetical protein
METLFSLCGGSARVQAGHNMFEEDVEGFLFELEKVHAGISAGFG